MAQKRINLLNTARVVDVRLKYEQWIHRGVLVVGLVVLSILGVLFFLVQGLKAKEAALTLKKKTLLQRQVQLADVASRAQLIESKLALIKKVAAGEPDYKKYTVLLTSLIPEATSEASINSLTIKTGNSAELSIHTTSSESTQAVLSMFERDDIKKQFKKLDITRLIESAHDDTESTDVKVSISW